MKSKLQNRKQNGFTIIEVLIVLAIAGLIMLIVFLAVPALQRNQRNNARKNDVSRIGGAVSEFYSNNNGKVPSTSDLQQIKDTVGKLSSYDGAADITIANANSTAPVTAVTGNSSLQIRTSAKCAPSGGTSISASPRQAVIQYAIETNGNPISICQDI